MQLLRDVELNMQQVINFRATLQAQVARAIATLGMKEIRELRGRYDTIVWPLMEQRVEDRRRRRADVFKAVLAERPAPISRTETGKRAVQIAKSPSDCGVAAIVSNRIIPS